MSQTLDLELWWPDLFEGLSSSQRHSVVQALAANWHEGWVPNYADVRNLTDLVRGTITRAEYKARSTSKA